MVEEMVEVRQVDGGGAGRGAFEFPDLAFCRENTYSLNYLIGECTFRRRIKSNLYYVSVTSGSERS